MNFQPERASRVLWLAVGLVVAAILLVGAALLVEPDLYPFVDAERTVTLQGSEEPEINPNATWKVNTKERLSACDNRPGLKKIYVTVLDDIGELLRGVKVHFDVEPSQGIAYDHPNVWGLTNENGYLVWDHLGIPTRYMLFMGDDETPLIVNIRTDLGNEYCKPPGTPWWRGNRPVNRPGIFSYRFEIQEKPAAE